MRWAVNIRVHRIYLKECGLDQEGGMSWSAVKDEEISYTDYEQTIDRIISYPDAIRETLKQAMAASPEVFLFGEGINDQPALFGVTTDLYKEFGEDRVFDIPLSENALMGVATGAALAGMRPVYFHNRPDFLLLAMDQFVNHATKYNYMSGGQCSVPMVIWAAIGKGWGAAGQHSQCPQAFFAHVPGCKVLMPATPFDSKGLLRSAIEDNNPVVILEHRTLLNQSGHVPEEEYRIPIGKGVIRRRGTEVTIVADSLMVQEAIKAADILESEGISAEVIDLRSIKPWDEELVYQSVIKTGRLLIADTAWYSFGVGAEIAATIGERAFGYLKCGVMRVAYPDIPAPASVTLENAFYVGVEVIIRKVKDALCDNALRTEKTFIFDVNI